MSVEKAAPSACKSVQEGYVMNAECNRAHAVEQPAAFERVDSPRPSIRWLCYAKVAKKQTGKASGWTYESFPCRAPTREECLDARVRCISAYMVGPSARAPPSKRLAPADTPVPRPKRAATPASFAMPKQKPGPSTPRAGPGRGHTYEVARPLVDQIRESLELPPCDAETGNWFQRMQLKQQWTSARMAQLERQVEELLAVTAQQSMTITALRDRVSELENLQHTIATEIMSYVESSSVLKESTHAQKLEENPEWALILGLGYNEGQKKNLIYKHLAKLLAELRRITGGDVMKAKQLSDLLYLRVHAAGNKQRQARETEKQAQHRNDVNDAIVSSIFWFVNAMHNAAGDGRYPQKVRQAQHVIATAVSQAAALSTSKTSASEIATLLGLDRHLLTKCRERYDALTDGEWQQLFDDRGSERSDKMPRGWIEFATEFWTEPELTDEHGNVLNFVRRSEKSSDEMRDPQDRKSLKRYRIVWLEEKVQTIYATMLRMGKILHGDAFHMSWTYFLELRPFYVKDAQRDTCMCVYHLRWREFANGLINYRKALRQQKVSMCTCTWPANEKQLRKQLICCPSSGAHEGHQANLDNLGCMLQTCPDCRDLKKLTDGPGALCPQETRDHGQGLALKVHYESYEKISYHTKDGTEKVRKDFVSKELPFSEFRTELLKYWPKFIAHHNDAKWHDNDFAALKSKLPTGKAGLVIDYAENYSHQPRFEHQSKYFCQVQTTIIPIVLMLRLEDLTNIDQTERAELTTLFDELQLPHVISETHCVISSDMNHDNAMVQKALDDFIVPYLRANAPTVSGLHIRSDGCKAQFKCAANFHWVSRQSAEGSGLQVHWSFFESCHGKCYCDPEGGTLKNSARHHELTISNQEDQLKDSHSLFTWARDKSGLDRPKLSLRQKKGRGIYRRCFYWVPSKGVGSVNRSRLPKLKADGTSRLHEFRDIGRVGIVSTRRASCHQCDECWRGNQHNCENKEYTGLPVELTITRETTPAAAAARIDRATLNREAITRAGKAAIGSVIGIETHNDEQTVPWVIGSVVDTLQSAPFASPPYDPSTDLIRFEPVRANEPALRVTLYEPLQMGSSTYFLSEHQMWVPARRVRVTDIELEVARESRLGGGRSRFKIDAASLELIAAAMPAANDSWEVDHVSQYRCLYGVEQWLVRWKGYDEAHNTWEPWDSLLMPEVQSEARRARTVSLPRDLEGLSKVVFVTLKAALAERNLSVSGLKSELVSRLHAALDAES